MTEGHYCQEFVSKCAPFFIQGFNAIYKNTLKKCSKRKLLLKEFQEALESIHLWNSKIIENEYSRFKIASNCNWLEDLIKAAFVELSEIISKEKRNIDDDIPKGEVFVHKCYINIAREIWRKPQLFYHDYSNTEKAQNQSEVTKIIHDVISKTIRNELPLQTIVDDYLHQQHKPVDVETEDVDRRKSFGGKDDFKEEAVKEDAIKEDAIEEDAVKEDAIEEDAVKEDKEEESFEEESVEEEEVKEESVEEEEVKEESVEEDKEAFEDDSMKTILFDARYCDKDNVDVNNNEYSVDNESSDHDDSKEVIREVDIDDHENDEVNYGGLKEIKVIEKENNGEVNADDQCYQDVIISEDITVDENETDNMIENLDTNVVLKVNANKIEICEAEESDDGDDFDIKIEEINDEDEKKRTVVKDEYKYNKKMRNTEKIKSILGSSIEYDEFRYNKDQLKKKLLLQKKYI